MAVQKLPFTKMALQDKSGRMAVATKVPGQKSPWVWLDESQEKFDTKTLELGASMSLSFYEFRLCSLKMLQAMPPDDSSFPLMPRVFCNLLDVKEVLYIDYGGLELHHSWVANNHRNVCKQFVKTGYPFSEHHFFPSEKSFKAKAKSKSKATKGVVVETDADKPILGGICMENSAMSTIAVLFGFTALAQAGRQ